MGKTIEQLKADEKRITEELAKVHMQLFSLSSHRTIDFLQLYNLQNRLDVLYTDLANVKHQIRTALHAT